MGPEEGPFEAWVLVGQEAVQGLRGAGVQDYEGGQVWLWQAEQAFGAALAGPASGIGQWLVTHTSAAPAVVTMLGQLPVSELGLSGPLWP